MALSGVSATQASALIRGLNAEGSDVATGAHLLKKLGEADKNLVATLLPPTPQGLLDVKA